ncbi:MAG: PHP domain-containing protein [Chloroflexi bacterium]|nr:PHP domain-containing protein [Chloroflexota bacterium]
MIIDLHVHTVRGSSDSSLLPQEMLDEAYRIGLQGVCLTEHGGPWDRFEFTKFKQQQSTLLIINAMEVETNAGHMTVFGLDRYIPGIRDPWSLRKAVDNEGGFVVLAHPFRNLLQKPPYNSNNLLFRGWNPMPTTVEEALKHPVFDVIDAVEVANAGTADAENYFAWEVAKRLGKPMIGGSDAHSTNGLGRCVTVFQDRITNQDEFLEALRAKRFYPATGLLVGEVAAVEHR